MCTRLWLVGRMGSGFMSEYVKSLAVIIIILGATRLT